MAMTEEHKDKIRQAALRRWQNPEHRILISKKVSATITKLWKNKKYLKRQKACWEDRNKKSSESNKRWAQEHPNEILARNRKGAIKLKERWATDSEYRNHMSNAHKGNPGYWTGKQRSPETIAKQRATMKIVSMTPERRALQRAVRAKQIFPAKDTTIEVKIQKQLDILKVLYRKHEPIFGQPDVYIPKGKVCIFADGDYWHSTPRGVKRDWAVNARLKKEGYTIIRIREHVINSEEFQISDYL